MPDFSFITISTNTRINLPMSARNDFHNLERLDRVKTI